jgi:hypothetical protein
MQILPGSKAVVSQTELENMLTAMQAHAKNGAPPEESRTPGDIKLAQDSDEAETRVFLNSPIGEELRMALNLHNSRGPWRPPATWPAFQDRVWVAHLRGLLPRYEARALESLLADPSLQTPGADAQTLTLQANALVTLAQRLGSIDPENRSYRVRMWNAFGTGFAHLPPAVQGMLLLKHLWLNISIPELRAPIETFINEHAGSVIAALPNMDSQQRLQAEIVLGSCLRAENRGRVPAERLIAIYQQFPSLEESVIGCFKRTLENLDALGASAQWLKGCAEQFVQCQEESPSSVSTKIRVLLRQAREQYFTRDLARHPLKVRQVVIEAMVGKWSSLLLDGLQLTSVPECIGNLVGLTFLDLRNNRLTEVPDWIGNLTHLAQLELEHNQLTNLPVGIFDLAGCRINLAHNRFTVDVVTELKDAEVQRQHSGPILNFLPGSRSWHESLQV